MGKQCKKKWQGLKLLHIVKRKIKSVKEYILKTLLKVNQNSKSNMSDKVDSLRYFELSEFECPCELGSGKKMDIDFLHKLDKARHIAKTPFKINSGYRCQEHNLKVGGRVGSSHLKGLAADIGYNGSRERYVIINALIQVGINRIGIAKTFVHCDVDNSKDINVIWLY